ncbi:hypothetical protein [Microbacterium sp.]|uniref:hypothetical protein n=1 Tax=Microbacterium sp. TaxID=51671 RepID=UPI00373545FA
MEQKNWARGRELVGYLRYDTLGELELLNRIWELDRVFANYLLPQQKLVSKTRAGAKVIKKYDAPATPHQRATRDPTVGKMPVLRMNAEFRSIHPAALSRQILALTGRLEAISVAKRPAPVKPPVHDSFNPTFSHRSHAEVSN